MLQRGSQGRCAGSPIIRDPLRIGGIAVNHGIGITKIAEIVKHMPFFTVPVIQKPRRNLRIFALRGDDRPQPVAAKLLTAAHRSLPSLRRGVLHGHKLHIGRMFCKIRNPTAKIAAGVCRNRSDLTALHQFLNPPIQILIVKQRVNQPSLIPIGDLSDIIRKFRPILAILNLAVLYIKITHNPKRADDRIDNAIIPLHIVKAVTHRHTESGLGKGGQYRLPFPNRLRQRKSALVQQILSHHGTHVAGHLLILPDKGIHIIASVIGAQLNGNIRIFLQIGAQIRRIRLNQLIKRQNHLIRNQAPNRASGVIVPITLHQIGQLVRRNHQIQITVRTAVGLNKIDLDPRCRLQALF